MKIWEMERKVRNVRKTNRIYSKCAENPKCSRSLWLEKLKKIYGKRYKSKEIQDKIYNLMISKKWYSKLRREARGPDSIFSDEI